MKISIFEIVNGKIIVNQHCLMIPELKAVIDFYEDPLPALAYLYYRYDPASTYLNTPEDEREEIIMIDFPGEYTTEDEVLIEASSKLEKLYMTPTKRYYLDNKILLEKLGAFGRDNEISTGRDGNYASMLSQIKSVGKTIEEFKLLEKIVEQEAEELSSKVRGGKKLAYDSNL